MTENDPRPPAGRHGVPDDDPATTDLIGVHHVVPGRSQRWRFVLVTVLAVVALGLAVTAGLVIDRLAVGAPAPVAVAPPSSAPPSTTTITPPPTTTTARASRTISKPVTKPTTTRATTKADTAPGCGGRAVARGVFNPACAEYQGYLDPGRAAGRQPSSGDLQTEYGCEKGYIPKSECPG
ncbi:hypothetical protein [Actinomycetospora soli]|uniref:hypothetical protein n=1 Tax=Actinomycetospora soli TaxID=2893887 RepID=UPI001E53186C|nr:hypothetical protein [Actinomycetospora soli]MCD2187788.1 hypothetical protein [Actinomycetospora soli]